MLVIKKIKLLLVKLNRYKLLNHVKVGYGTSSNIVESSFAVNQKKPMLVDKKYIEWKEDLTLPLYLHKPL